VNWQDSAGFPKSFSSVGLSLPPCPLVPFFIALAGLISFQVHPLCVLLFLNFSCRIGSSVQIGFRTSPPIVCLLFQVLLCVLFLPQFFCPLSFIKLCCFFFSLFPFSLPPARSLTAFLWEGKTRVQSDSLFPPLLFSPSRRRVFFSLPPFPSLNCKEPNVCK